MSKGIELVLNGTKAETLLLLHQNGFPVPMVFFFSVREWNSTREEILRQISKQYSKFDYLAIRSSAKKEDTSENSMAGAFHSVLNVNSKNADDISKAIVKVIKFLDGDFDNQILVQPMISDAILSGVIMTKVLDDGSPYYVINYDDSTGKTDTVTNGLSINKTVYIYNGVNQEDFDSPYLLSVIKLVWELESVFQNIPLDIEFAVDKLGIANLLQVRRITTSDKWNHRANAKVSERIKYLVEYVDKLMKPRTNLAGSKTLLGLMPDWNPAEMIGVVPRPLSLSLYRELITKSSWRIAREKMGYRKMPDVELMVSLFGRTYIDVRNSLNSFLPEGLNEDISERIINACIERLEQNPHLHDKIEFEIIQTAYDFQFDEKFNNRYPGIIKKDDFRIFKRKLKEITFRAIIDSPDNSLNQALQSIEQLKIIQNTNRNHKSVGPFSLSDYINTLIGECTHFGTIPFSIIARHGFIAEGLLRSLTEKNIIDKERISLFRRSFRTIAGELSEDFYKVCNNSLDKSVFLDKYGHLRPSSYDILSPQYRDRGDLFDGEPKLPLELFSFKLLPKEVREIDSLLAEEGFDKINAGDLIRYAQKAIVGREYAKFIFTKHLSEILENIAMWGELQEFDRSQMSMLTLNEILSILFAPLTNDDKEFYKERIEKAKKSYDIASSFKLSYLIRTNRDIYVVPQQRSTPNFISQKRIEANTFLLNPYIDKIPDLHGKIVCIEGADPGYDWIFSRNIAGLVTKYGGANSHMAIRCAEYNLPAAIGCGEQPFERIISTGRCLLDCQCKRLEPVSLIK